MVENKKFQISVLQRMLRKERIDTDLIDLEAEVDETLSLEENANIMRETLRSIMINEEKMDTKDMRKLERFMEAVRIFASRKNSQKMVDQSRQARVTFEKKDLTKENYEKWKNSPNKYDIKEVDSKFGY